MVDSLANVSVSTDESAIVDDHVPAFNRRCLHVAVDVHTIGEVSLATDSQRIALDRVLGEALANVAKHARANTVTIWIHGLRSAVLVQIRDDGCGSTRTNQRRATGWDCEADRAPRHDRR
jgi:glucose-6-phosphate-specific signal transduction histidine kinase